MPSLLILSLLVLTGGETQGQDHCSVEDIDKWDCAPNEAACMEAGCCWVPAATKDIPWCFCELITLSQQ